VEAKHSAKRRELEAGEALLETESARI